MPNESVMPVKAEIIDRYIQVIAALRWLARSLDCSIEADAISRRLLENRGEAHEHLRHDDAAIGIFLEHVAATHELWNLCEEELKQLVDPGRVLAEL